MQKTQIEKILNNVGINPTRQREKIFNYLAKYNTHPTADEIYQALISDGCNISRATVYNTLNKFKDKDIVRVVMIDKDVERFDLNFTEHAHFRCERCHKIYDVHLPKFKILPYFDLNSDTEVDKMEILLRGICSNCKHELEE